MESFISILDIGNKYAAIKYKNIYIETRFTETEIKDLFNDMLRDIELVDNKEVWKNSKHGYFTLEVSFPDGKDLIVINYKVESPNRNHENKTPVTSCVEFAIPYDEFRRIKFNFLTSRLIRYY